MTNEIKKAVLKEREECARLALTVKADKLGDACKAHYEGVSHCSDRRAEAIYNAIIKRKDP